MKDNLLQTKASQKTKHSINDKNREKWHAVLN